LIPFIDLKTQFRALEPQIRERIDRVLAHGQFVMGPEIDELEEKLAAFVGVRHCISASSGTDTLLMTMMALDIDKGDEVITTPFTFYATIGAIVTSGATPVFVDAGADCNIDVSQIEAKISPKTKAIMPVHWSGKPCEMDQIEDIAVRHNLAVISDACHAIKAIYKGRSSGALGTLACFSFHPLKNLNVWGDGGIITTNSDDLANKLRLIRNHGLVGRNECRTFGYNSRLDTVQAVVARHLLAKIDHITHSRESNAAYFDDALRSIPQITVPKREKDIFQVYHLYQILCQERDALQNHLIAQGVDAKVHYPVPMHLQPAAEFLGYCSGDFPTAERISATILSLPVHEFITREQQNFMIQQIRDFYA